MYLLDTNVISELRKARTGGANPQVVAWADATPVPLLFTSVIVLHEIAAGAQDRYACMPDRHDEWI